MLSAKRKRELDVDLWIILIISAFVLGIYNVFSSSIKGFISNGSVNIVLRVLVEGVVQFGLAGLGITVVAIVRKENFLNYGLNRKKIIITLLLSVGCCIPAFIYRYFTGNIQAWLPFSGVNTTAAVLDAGFPSNVLGMCITAVCWGFFEGFNYVVICEKISERYPSRIRFWDWGAFLCAILCILIHGAVGVTPNAVIEMLCELFLIYGMLMVHKITGNAWGCVLIFILYWNALS